MLLLCVFVQDHCKVKGLPPMDGKDFQKHQCTSKSPRPSLSIAITLGESVSQLLAMEKSCGSQRRVCFSEKSGMMGVFAQN